MKADNMERGPQWKGYLLQLQHEAPKPLLVECRKLIEKPPYYGEECHGLISREEGERLCKREGNYLIRESQNEKGRFTLVLRVLETVKNFKLYYEDGKHFVGEKKFDDIYSLAEDGLITMYVEGKAQSYIDQMNKSPVYSSLSRYSYNRRNNRQDMSNNEYSLGYNADCDETQSYYDEDMRMATYQPAVSHTNAVAGQFWNNVDKLVINGPSPHLKKNLTPTSSDERRNRNKKKQRSLDESIYMMRRESGGSTSESSITSSELRRNVLTSSPRRTPIPQQDKYALDANENLLPYKIKPNRSPAPSNGQIVTKRESDFFKCCKNDENANSFHQLRQFIEETEANNGETPPTNRIVQRSKTSVSNRPTSARQHTVSNNAHYRQRSEPVELINMSSAFNRSERCTPPLSEHDELVIHQEMQSRGGAARTKKSVAYCGSGGSCDSSLSNVSNLSTGSSALPPQNDILNKPPLDAVSHVSSEEGIGDDRGSTPSPESTNQRRYIEQHDNLYSSNMMNRSYHGFDHHRIHNSTSDNRLINCHEDNNKFSRSDPAFALKRSPTYHGRELHKHEERKERHKSSGETLPEYDEENLHFCQLTNKTHVQPTVTRRESFKEAQNKSQVTRSKSTPSPRKPKLRENSSSPVNQIQLNKSKSSPRDYDKEHSFKRQTYHGLQWCEYCGNFMWGIVQQGMQCKDCGLNVHKQCAKMVPGNCQPALKHIKQVFGIDLTTLVKLHGTERPVVVDKCIYELENRGLASEGLYRVNGFHDQVQEIKQEFNRHGGDVDLSNYDVNTIACAFKMYLRELPVPLLPYILYSRFINASKLSEIDEKLDAIHTALKQMPAAHMNTLIFIISHLGRICESPGNHMDPHNLGIVFGPTMLRAPEKESGYGLNDATYQQEIIETMIQYRSELFGTVLNTIV